MKIIIQRHARTKPSIRCGEPSCGCGDTDYEALSEDAPSQPSEYGRSEGDALHTLLSAHPNAFGIDAAELTRLERTTMLFDDETGFTSEEMTEYLKPHGITIERR